MAENLVIDLTQSGSEGSGTESETENESETDENGKRKKKKQSTSPFKIERDWSNFPLAQVCPFPNSFSRGPKMIAGRWR